MATFQDKSSDRMDVSSARPVATSMTPLILVVENHDDTRFMLEYLLEMRGCRVAVAEDGEVAVQLAENERPDLILMDVTLPRLDGLAATRRIRETSALRDVPIILLSGRAEVSFRTVALSTGGNDFVVKPFALDQLERVIERHLGKSLSVKTQ
ncbi:MAG TPA: response regulator [Pyrinomonadaceae bacterium]